MIYEPTEDSYRVDIEPIGRYKTKATVHGPYASSYGYNVNVIFRTTERGARNAAERVKRRALKRAKAAWARREAAQS